MSEPFFDSNVLLYLLSTDIAKASRSEALLDKGGVVSVQTLNECLNAGRKRLKRTLGEIDALLSVVRSQCEVLPLSMEIHERGRQLHERYRLSVYDAMIVAAALLAGCGTLWSEDMQDGFAIEGLTIRNPYKP